MERLFQDEPLFVESNKLEEPTATKLLFPQVTSRSGFVVGEVAEVQEFPESPTDTEVHVVPSDEVRMVDDSPTATNALLS